MPVDTRKKRMGALQFGNIAQGHPGIDPSGEVTKTSRYVVWHSYPPAGDGVLLLLGTTMGTAIVPTDDTPGVYWDESGNMRVTGTLSEGP
jgi:hypothetical protein